VTGYIVRRLIAMVLMLLVLTLVVFLLFSVLPADPARLTCGKACSPAVIEANRHNLGLDLPVWQQYWEYLKGIFVGRTYGSGTQTYDCSAPCLGYSFKRGEEVTVLIKEAFPTTFWLAIGAFVIWISVGVSVGIYSALRRGKWQDKLVMGVSLVGYSLPSFFVGLVLLFIVIIKLQWLPYPSYVSPFENPVQFLQTMILPWIVLAFLYAAFYMRLTRNQMLDALGEDYIRTARSKGLRERIVIRRHGLRAGLTPIVTAAGLDLAGLLGGALFTEQIYNLPGLGNLAVDSVVDSDLPLIVGITLVTATFIIVANLIVDLLYAVIDPRVRLV
jgi:peptide/nickel transport system permease protein